MVEWKGGTYPEVLEGAMRGSLRATRDNVEVFLKEPNNT